MSIRVMSWVWANSPEKGSALLLLLAIADFADDRGNAFPSVGTLADKIRMTTRNTQLLIEKLVKSDALEVMRGKGPRGCNLFRVKGLQGELFDGEGVKKPAAGGETATSPEPSVKPSREPSLADQTFEKVFALLPKRAGGNPKHTALKAWRARIKEGRSAVDMEQGAIRYAAFIRATGKENTEYVMQASTFFGPAARFLEDYGIPVASNDGGVDLDWWRSTDGIKAKAEELRITRADREDLSPAENWAMFRIRVFVAAGDGPWIDTRNATEMRLVNRVREEARA